MRLDQVCKDLVVEKNSEMNCGFRSMLGIMRGSKLIATARRNIVIRCANLLMSLITIEYNYHY